MAAPLGVASAGDVASDTTSYFLTKAIQTSLATLDISELRGTLEDIQVALQECCAPRNSHQDELKHLKAGVLEAGQLINKLGAQASKVLQGIETDFILNIEPPGPESEQQTNKVVLKPVSAAQPTIIARSNIIPEQAQENNRCLRNILRSLRRIGMKVAPAQYLPGYQLKPHAPSALVPFQQGLPPKPPAAVCEASAETSPSSNVLLRGITSKVPPPSSPVVPPKAVDTLLEQTTKPSAPENSAKSSSLKAIPTKRKAKFDPPILKKKIAAAEKARSAPGFKRSRWLSDPKQSGESGSQVIVFRSIEQPHLAQDDRDQACHIRILERKLCDNSSAIKDILAKKALGFLNGKTFDPNDSLCWDPNVSRSDKPYNEKAVYIDAFIADRAKAGDPGAVDFASRPSYELWPAVKSWEHWVENNVVRIEDCPWAKERVLKMGKLLGAKEEFLTAVEAFPTRSKRLGYENDEVGDMLWARGKHPEQVFLKDPGMYYMLKAHGKL